MSSSEAILSFFRLEKTAVYTIAKTGLHVILLEKP